MLLLQPSIQNTAVKIQNNLIQLLSKLFANLSHLEDFSALDSKLHLCL